MIDQSAPDFTAARRRMIAQHLRPRGIADAQVLAAMNTVPRECFIPPTDWADAYADQPVRIACDQTISQPYIVAYMTQALAIEAGMRVLEIGTGSGYQTAILAELGAQVFTIERHEPLLAAAIERCESLGYAERIEFAHDDGTLGWAEKSPFDRILVTAAGPDVPASLQAQLTDGGRLLIPTGTSEQRLTRIQRSGETFSREDLLSVRFVKLIGAEGFTPTDL